MSEWLETPFDKILLDSKDGEWGIGEEAVGHQLAEIIRGTDFADLREPDKKLPQRWVKDHLVERKQLISGDLILETAGGTTTQSTGRVAIVRETFFHHHDQLPVLCASFSRHLRLDQEKYCAEFVYYLLKALYNSGYMAVYNLQHTGVSRFQYTTFKKKTKLRIPALPAQRKIAAILTAYDDLIETNQRRITLLERMAEAIYREWFVRLRFPGHETATFEKGVPVGWETSTLDKVADITMGQSPKSEFYNEIGDGLPFHQGVGTYGSRFPKKAIYCNSGGRKAHRGDILFSVRAPVGRLNIADCEMIIGRGLAAISHKHKLNSYLYYCLKTLFANEDIIGNGSIFNSVGKDELAGFGLLSPPQELAVKYDQIASNIDEQIALLTRASENILCSKGSLLSRLISGKLSVEDLDIQYPPSMLTETQAVLP